MTINLSDNSPRVSYSVAQGVTQSSFAVPFEFFDDGDLNVYVDGTLKILTSDYTVSGGDGTTGTVTISVTGASGGSTVVITRDIDLERTTDFPSSGPFNIGSLNTELDRIIAIAADLNDRSARSIQAQDFDTTASYTLPLLDDRKGTVLAFNETTGDVQAGPDIADVQSIALVSADLALLADIQDGTVSTNAITNVSGIRTDVSTVSGISSDVTTVSGISSNVTTVSGISSNVTTVSTISSNVTTVAGIASDVTTVSSNSSNVTTVATNINNVNTVASNITNINTVANDLLEVVSEIETVANDLNEATSEIEVVANNIANVNTVGGISGNVTTVAGISSDVTTVSGISGNVTSVASISADISTVASISSSDLSTVAGISTDVTSVAGISSEVTTVAGNLSDVTNFFAVYRTGTSEPSTLLDTGDLFYNTSTGTLKIYNGTGWEAGVTAGSGFLPTTGGGLTGDLTFGDNVKATFGASSDLQIYHDGSDSYVKDAGTGYLNLLGTGRVVVGHPSNGHVYLNANYGGDVELFFNNSKKLETTSTGVDITGTLTSDNIGIGTSSPSYALSANGVIQALNTNNSAESILLGNDNTSAYIYTNAAQPMTFWTNNSEAMRIDSSGNVGIGETSPSVSLDISATDAVQMPAGTDAQRPSSPANGMIRYSTTSGSFEGYQAGAWSAIGGGGDVGAPTLSGSSSANEFSDTTVTITDYDATLIYRVSVTGGSYTRSGGTITWTLPSVTTDTIHYMTVNAIDNGVTSPDAEWDIDVLNVAFTGDTGIQITNFASNTSNTGWAV